MFHRVESEFSLVNVLFFGDIMTRLLFSRYLEISR